MLEEKIEKLRNVWSVIRRSDDGRYLIGVTFPDGYGVYNSADDRIHVLDDTKGESRLYWYVAQVTWSLIKQPSHDEYDSKYC